MSWFRRKAEQYTASVMSTARLAEESVPVWARPKVREIEQALEIVQTMPNKTLADRQARAATLQAILDTAR